jgi:hypothetical protein
MGPFCCLACMGERRLQARVQALRKPLLYPLSYGGTRPGPRISQAARGLLSALIGPATDTLTTRAV